MAWIIWCCVLGVLLAMCGISVIDRPGLFFAIDIPALVVSWGIFRFFGWA